MRFTLFRPNNKVQKDRDITQQLDQSMALFGRNTAPVMGLAYVLYLIFGSLPQQAPQLAIGLGCLLLPILGAIVFLAIGFERLYPHGASRWRQYYLCAILVEIVWLSILLCCITLIGNFDVETLLVWLMVSAYAFVAMTVFAPYTRLALILVSLLYVPGILSLVSVMSSESLLLATGFTVLYVVLIHQNKISGKNFWQMHETNYLLHQKMNTLEAQKKQDVAKIELNYEFVANLGQELKTTLNDILGGLTLLQDTELGGAQQELVNLTEKASERQVELVDNIIDFAKISKKTLVIDNNVFGLRRDLEDILATLASEAHDYNIELNYVIQDDLPYRAKGDGARIRQVISGLVHNMIRFSEGGEVFVDIRTDQWQGDRYLLSVNIYDEGQRSFNKTQAPSFDAFSQIKHTRAGTGLGMAICKGLTECMQGQIGIDNQSSEARHYWLKLPIEINSNNSHYFVPNVKLEGAKLLIVDPPKRVRSHLKSEFSSWGLQINCVDDFREAKNELLTAIASEEPYQAMLGYTHLSDSAIINTFQRLAEKAEFSNLHQFIVASQLQIQSPQWREILGNYPQLNAVKKPLNHKAFHQQLVQRLFNLDLSLKRRINVPEVLASDPINKCKILLVEDHRVNQMVAEGMLKKLGYQPHLAKNGREALDLIDKEKFDLVLMDCQMAEMDGYQATQEIRYKEKSQELESHIPIIALTAHTAEEDKSRCLAAGMDDYLAKPVRYDDLESRLRRWLGDAQNSRHH